MPWQQHVADVIGEIDPDTGRLAYTEFGLTVPRQSGKSTLLLAKAVHRASATSFFGPRQQIVYTAQTRKDARKKWEEDYAGDLAVSRMFGPKIAVHLGNGNEHIRFPNRSRFGIESTTEKAGHGPTLDEAYVDEAFAQADARTEQAFRPAMITRKNKQLGWVSTAGWDDYGSDWLKSKVQAGRAAVAADVRQGLAYFEWSAPEGSDPADRAVWRACMPALGFTITEDAIADEFRAMLRADFCRAYLNLWVPRTAGAARVIEETVWNGLADPESQITGALAFAVHVNRDRAQAAVAVAGYRADGRRHVEVIEHAAGTDWIVPMLTRLVASHDPCAVVLDARGAAASLLPDLELAGIEAVVTNAAQMGQACGGFYDAAVHDSLRHLGDPLLDAAVGLAKTAPCGDAWKWNTRDGSDISVLIAATLADYGLVVHGRTVPAPPPQLIRSESGQPAETADLAIAGF